MPYAGTEHLFGELDACPRCLASATDVVLRKCPVMTPTEQGNEVTALYGCRLVGSELVG